MNPILPMPVLQVRSLNLTLDPARRRLHVLRGIDLHLRPAEILGIIGESGSGKTMLGLSLLRLEPGGAAITAETMQLAGTDLLHASQAALQAVRGRTIGMIFQDPVGAFNPAKRIAWHAREVIRKAHSSPLPLREGPGVNTRQHSPDSSRDSRETNTNWHHTAAAMLANVDIADTARVLGAYPHQLSGGMLQRVLIALILAARPAIVIADESTTNLDNIVERQILALFRRFRESDGAAFIVITHDMSLAATLCDRIAVMYAGEIVEIGATTSLFASPKHPYTQALIATAQALQSQALPGGGEAGGRLPELAGEPPALTAARSGCAFASRCPHRMDACIAAPIPMVPQPGGNVRCLLYAP